MPTLTKIEPCEAPVLSRDLSTGPSIEMDHRILNFLRAQRRNGVELRYITEGAGGTTHHVHARLQTLIDRGLVARERIPGGPKRGPGASQYVLTSAGWGTP